VDSFFRRWERDKKIPSTRSFGASGEEIIRGALRIEPKERLVNMNDRPVRVFGKEFEILKLLAESPGKVFSREMIIKAVWKTDRLTSERNVDNHIKRLRSKFKKFTGHSEWIETVRKDGYRFTNYYDSIPVIPQ